MPKLIVSVPDDIENRLRPFTRRRGDLSRLVTQALDRYVTELEKQRLKALKSTQKSVGEYYKERRFANLVKVEGRFTLDGADLQLVIDDAMRTRKLDELLEEEVKADHKAGPFEAIEHEKTVQEVRYVPPEERAERDFYALLKEKIEDIREWALSELKENGVNANRVRICFDPEEGLRLCTGCGYPTKEFNECWNCGCLY